MLVCALCTWAMLYMHRNAVTEPFNPATRPRPCTLTWYESFPTTDAEASQFSGDKYEGQFASLDEARDKWWVKNRNIVAVHSDKYRAYVNRWVRVYWGGKVIDCKVIDKCADDDTRDQHGNKINQCSKNRDWPLRNPTGFLIDMEIHTAKRIGFDKVGKAVGAYKLISSKQVKTENLHGAYPPGTRDRWGQVW